MEQYKRSILLIGETPYDPKCEIICYKHASSSQMNLNKRTKFSSKWHCDFSFESFQSDSVVYPKEKMDTGNQFFKTVTTKITRLKNYLFLFLLQIWG